MLGEIIVDTQGVLAAVAEVLANGTARIRCEVLQWRGIGGRGGYHDRVGHRVGINERLDHLSDGGTFLADGYVDTNDVATLLIDDRVNCHSGLTRLAVANDQFALAASDRD